LVLVLAVSALLSLTLPALKGIAVKCVLLLTTG